MHLSNLPGRLTALPADARLPKIQYEGSIGVILHIDIVRARQPIPAERQPDATSSLMEKSMTYYRTRPPVQNANLLRSCIRNRQRHTLPCEP